MIGSECRVPTLAVAEPSHFRLVRAAGSVPGTATPQDPNNANHVIFQSYYHAQRPALLLAQGQVWCGLGSVC